jgi:[ribosomal protein S5]-alanine N-acetyltransferase
MEFKLPDVLHTARLIIRPLALADLDALFPIFSDEEATRYWLPTPWRERANSQQWFARVQARHAEQVAMQFVIIERGSNDVVGICLLFKFDLANRRAEVGYAMTRTHWGRGYAGEATRRLLEFGFGELGLRRIEAEVDPRNLGSVKVLSRLGFEQEGLLRERWDMRGELSDSALFGLLQRDWEQRKT